MHYIAFELQLNYGVPFARGIRYRAHRNYITVIQGNNFQDASDLHFVLILKLDIPLHHVSRIICLHQAGNSIPIHNHRVKISGVRNEYFLNGIIRSKK